MARFRCVRCDVITESSIDLANSIHDDCDEDSGAWVKLPEVSPINPEDLRVSNLTGLIGRLDQVLDQYGFCYMGQECTDYHESELLLYKDWQIGLDIPNGGILAVDIIYHPTGDWWGVPTHEEFGYYNGEEIIAFAKQVIDEVDRYLAEAPGQLSLFEVAE